MAEPPTKRPRRVDSATMWETNGRRTHSPDSDMDRDSSTRREQPISKSEGRREPGRDERRHRSRSRDRKDSRRDRSRSRDRRDRDWDRRDRVKGARGPRDRERSRSRSPDRSYQRRGPPPKTDRFRDRSRSPARSNGRARTRTPPPPSRGQRTDRRETARERGDEKRLNGTADARIPLPHRHQDEMDVDLGAVAGEDEFEEIMRRSMGFTNFRSTKNTKVPGNNIYGVRKEKKTQYRQYMNRVGGFNRPLSPG